jgi:hypothetical protein
MYVIRGARRVRPNFFLVGLWPTQTPKTVALAWEDGLETTFGFELQSETHNIMEVSQAACAE